ncbi:MAG TPA: STAS domain-containing protein [Planctomycetaceae bacterium]|jgi:hypothetical protein
MTDEDDFVLGEPEPPKDGGLEDDSGVLVAGPHDPDLLTFVRDGSRVIVGFNSKGVPDEVCVAGYREQLLKTVEESCCHTLTFDLTGIRIIPSGMLGLLVTMKNRGQAIEILNPSADIQEVLRVTRLLTLFTIRPPV